MSIPKSKRKPSQFEVFARLTEMRREITNLALHDFGYDEAKAAKHLEKRLGGKTYGDLSPDAQRAYNARADRDYALHQWFIAEERSHVIGLMRDISVHVYEANSIYPVCDAERAERRLHQDRAVGLLYALTVELQYVIETLPVDVNRYMRFADMVTNVINLIKGWRKSDNKRAASASSSRFANVNGNGNANNNTASNVNGVRPDLGATADKSSKESACASKGEAVLS